MWHNTFRFRFAAKMNPAQNIEYISPDNLLLDAKNPRLVGLLTSGKVTQRKLLEEMRKYMDLDELAASIVASGFYPHEPLFVEKAPRNKYVVIEGNRRLATVRLLLDDGLRKELDVRGMPALKDKKSREGLKALPVWITDRKSAWQAIAFKHVNGPMRWGSYEKAQYAATLHKEYRISLDTIAENIGDSHQTVVRLYRALMIVEQAEREGIFDRNNSFKAHFSFSHLYTGVGYLGIARFIGVEKDAVTKTESPVPKSKRKELSELLTWIYGDKSKEIRPRVRSQNPDIRNLSHALGKESGVKALRAGSSIIEAMDSADGDNLVLRACLQKAKSNLEKASGKAPNGFDGDAETIRMAENISVLADELVQSMERKRSRAQKRG